MTNEQAKSELMQIYGVLSEEKKQALDVLMAQNCDQCEVGNPCLYCEHEFKAQADRNEFYNWDAPIRHKADGEYILKSEAIRVASGYCHPSNIAKELEKLPSVDIPPDHDGCKDCVYQDNPQDAMPCRECKHNYMDKWKARPKEEPRYCDRNICLRNEYNGIGCDECEVGNPCLYCKHDFEPQERSEE